MNKPVITRRTKELIYEPTDDIKLIYGRFLILSENKSLITYEGKEVYKKITIPCRSIFFDGNLIGAIEYYKYTKALTRINWLWIPDAFSKEEEKFRTVFNATYYTTGFVLTQWGWEIINEPSGDF